MRSRHFAVAGGLLLAVLLLFAVPSGGRAGNTQDSPPRSVTCAFSNPSYSGWCRETRQIPAGGSGEQVCTDLLNCLNNTQCSETLCNATTIRGGWKIESVEVAGEGNP
ncbi:MAG TPA: hypothetical protein VIB08_02160 [Thermoanaerobaculia bacterium]|jgi:hypothetical protein